MVSELLAKQSGINPYTGSTPVSAVLWGVMEWYVRRT